MTTNIRLIGKTWTSRLVKIFAEIDKAKRALAREPIHKLDERKVEKANDNKI